MYKIPFVIAALLFAGSATAQLEPPAQHTLTYDSNTGSLSVDTQGQVLYSYVIKLPGDTTIPGGFIQENFIQLPGSPNSNNVTNEDLELGDTNITGWTNPTANSLGNVLPTGLSQSEYEATFSEAFYANEFGTQTVYDFGLVFVPEPTSLVLLAAGGILLGYRRGNRDQR